MKNLRRILESDEANWDWLKSACHDDSDNLQAELEFYKKMHYLFQESNFFYMVVNRAQSELEYCSQGVTSMLGFSPEEFNLHFFYNQIHPDDLGKYIEFDARAGSFLKSLTPDKITKYKARFDFRIRHSNGHYVWLMEQELAIGYAENGEDLQLLVVFTDISHLKGTSGMYLSLIGLDGEPSFIQESALAPDNHAGVLSTREKELVKLLSQNKSSEQIAEQLCLSRHTVDNHRRNMLHKTGCTSTLQLVMLAVEKGWI